MPKADGKKLFSHAAQTVEDMRAWVNEVLEENGDPGMSFNELCELSGQILNLAKELTSLAILVTRAAQVQHKLKKK
jgi:hypothetical protein